MTEKIYIHLIDGAECWIPVDIEPLSENKFKIKEFDDFDSDESGVVPQFIPGDIVTRKLTTRNDEEFWIADKLLEPSDHPDKKYIEFLYRVITGDKLKDHKERLEYNEVIARTRSEIKDGKFHYPAIVNYVNGIKTV